MIALVATPGAVSSGWPGEVAKALARAWAARGSQIVLADAGLAVPTLHEAFGMENGEGLSDALLSGAAVGRVTRPAPEGGFRGISGGTPTAAGARAFAGGRWRRFRARFQEAGVTIVALVPEGEPGWASVVSTSTDVLILSEPSEDVVDVRNAAGDRVRAVLGSGSPGHAAPYEEEGAAAAPSVDSAPAGVDDGGEGQDMDEETWIDPLDVIAGPSAGRYPPRPVVPMEVMPQSPEVTPESPGVAPVRTRRRSRRKGGRHRWVVAGFAVVVVLLGMAVLWPIDLHRQVAGPVGEADSPAVAAPRVVDLDSAAAVTAAPDSEAAPAAAPTAQDSEAGPAAVPAAPDSEAAPPAVPTAQDSEAGLASVTAAPVEATPATPTLPAAGEAPLMGFSVALGSYRDGQSAARRAGEVRGRVPGVLVLVVPVEVDGALYHRVLAGPARDSADASRLAEEIARRGGVDAAGWVLRPTPMAFRLDETDDLAAARQRAEALSASGVPAYVLAVADADGSIRYRVYAGAYADAKEASYLAGLLRERDITTAVLSDRTGSLPE